MGRMKEQTITDAPRCRAYLVGLEVGEFKLSRMPGNNNIVIKHVSGEGGCFCLSTFEAKVCPWPELATTEGVAEKIAAFYAEHF